MTSFLLFLFLFLSISCISNAIHSISPIQIPSIPRKRLIAGNWKMNPLDLDSARKLARDVAKFSQAADPNQVEICIIPPFPFLSAVAQEIEGSNVKLGAQAAYFESKGAFTGAVSTPMLASLGVQYCVIGHSERRAIFKESDEEINQSLKAVLAGGLTPILCIGESKEEYDLGLNEAVCTNQLARALKGLTPHQVSQIVIAYEPVWAIGTGLTASPAYANQVHGFIRSYLSRSFGPEAASLTRILYGGSVTPANVQDLLGRVEGDRKSQEDVDGALVGGASLKADSFAQLCGL